MELKIEYLNIDQIEEYDNNTKIHDAEDVAEIAKSIERYGMIDPVGIWSDHNVLVEGHGRLYACRKLGITKIPCVRLDHLSEKERREYGIIHNKSAELSIWDEEKLKAEVEALGMNDFPAFWDEPLDLSEVGGVEEPKNEKILTLQLCEDQYQILMAVIDFVNENGLIEHDFGNKNKKSNAIFEGAYLWAESQNLI